MTYLEFISMIKSTGINTIYSHFPTAQTPPFICVLTDKTMTGSDFTNDIEEVNYRVEFYSKLNYDIANFTKLETLFNDRGIDFEATYGIYIQADNVFMTIYEINFYQKK